jgi:hypothetical protein
MGWAAQAFVQRVRHSSTDLIRLRAAVPNSQHASVTELRNAVEKQIRLADKEVDQGNAGYIRTTSAISSAIKRPKPYLKKAGSGD